MSYLLNLSLPLWWMFLPLIIATLCAYKYYQVRYILRSGVSSLKRDNSALQGKLEAALASEKTLRLSASQNLTQLKDALAKLHKLETDATEREALIVELNKQVTELTEKVAKNYELAQKHAVNMSDKAKEIEQLKSKLEVSELAHGETIDDLEGERYYIDAIAEAYKLLHGLVVRNSRPKKQFELALSKMAGIKRTAFENLNRSVLELADKNEVKKAEQKALVKTIIDDGRIEGIVYDSVGVPRVVKADQSENDNGRHDVLSICNEVSRGVKEQAEAIKKELASVVDMSQLEVGDKVVFRHGDVEVVREILKDGDDEQPYLVSTRNSVWYYTVSGKWQIVEDCDLDIVQIIKPAKCYKSNKPCQFNCDGLCKNS